MTTVRASFRKTASDGNYGSESAELTLEVEPPEGLTEDELDAFCAMWLATARRLVHSELDHSPSRNVRQALVYPPVREPNPHTMPIDGEDDEDDLPL